MRKLFVLGLVLCWGFAAMASQGGDEQVTPPVPIVRGEYGDHIKVRPRSIVSVPLTCIYKAGTVELCFMEDLGEAEVIVTSLTTGEQWYTTGDTATGVLTVPASDESGDYVVQIYADGDAWYGCYTL